MKINRLALNIAALATLGVNPLSAFARAQSSDKNSNYIKMARSSLEMAGINTAGISDSEILKMILKDADKTRGYIKIARDSLEMGGINTTRISDSEILEMVLKDAEKNSDDIKVARIKLEMAGISTARFTDSEMLEMLLKAAEVEGKKQTNLRKYFKKDTRGFRVRYNYSMPSHVYEPGEDDDGSIK